MGLTTGLELEDESGRFKMGLKIDERSICRDSSCELEEEEDESVGAAGAVEFVTICLLTCRGK